MWIILSFRQNLNTLLIQIHGCFALLTSKLVLKLCFCVFFVKNHIAHTKFFYDDVFHPILKTRRRILDGFMNESFSRIRLSHKTCVSPISIARISTKQSNSSFKRLICNLKKRSSFSPFNLKTSSWFSSTELGFSVYSVVASRYRNFSPRKMIESSTRAAEAS